MDLKEVEAAVASLDPNRAAGVIEQIRALVPPAPVEFPKMLHRRTAVGRLEELIVQSPEAEKTARSTGWQDIPPPAVPRVVVPIRDGQASVLAVPDPALAGGIASLVARISDFQAELTGLKALLGAPTEPLPTSPELAGLPQDVSNLIATSQTILLKLNQLENSILTSLESIQTSLGSTEPVLARLAALEAKLDLLTRSFWHRWGLRLGLARH